MLLPLQDGRTGNSQRPSATGRLHGEDRSHRRLLPRAHRQEGPAPSAVPMERSVIPVQLSSVRSSLNNPHVHEGHKTIHGGAPQSRVSDCHLHRRYTPDCVICQPVATPAVRAIVTPGKLGLDCQLGEVGSGANTNTHLPGHRNRLHAYAALPSQHQGQEGQESLPRAAAVHPCHNQGPCISARPPQLNCAGNPPGPSAHAGAPTPEGRMPKKQPAQLPGGCLTPVGISGRAPMVVRLPGVSQRQEHHCPKARLHHSDRHFQGGPLGLGSATWRANSWGPMDCQRASPAHQRAGAEGSNTRGLHLCQAVASGPRGHLVRQPRCDRLHQQDGGGGGGGGGNRSRSLCRQAQEVWNWCLA